MLEGNKGQIMKGWLPIEYEPNKPELNQPIIKVNYNPNISGDSILPHKKVVIISSPEEIL